MMHSHFVLLVLFAGCVSTVFAALQKDDGAGQLRLGGLMFAGFVGAALAGAWIMRIFPL